MEAWTIGLGLAGVAATLIAGFVGVRKSPNRTSTTTIQAPQTTLVHAPTIVQSPFVGAMSESEVLLEEDGGNEPESEESPIQIDWTLEINAGEQERIEFEADAGNRVTGLIESDGPIDIFLVPRDRYAAFQDGDGTGVIEWEDAETINVDRLLRKGGVWFLVADAYGKKRSRTVSVSLQVGP